VAACPLGRERRREEGDHVHDLDGRIGEAWSGESPNGSHVNVVLARRGSVTAAAVTTAFTGPTKGHTPVLVCLGAGTPVWPPTVMMNKSTAATERQERLTWGAAQLGIGEGVLDAVADGLLHADGETVVLVAVWVDPDADAEGDVRAANRDATHRAIRKAVEGPDPGEVDALLRLRGTATNAFFGRTEA
jgi:formaldehyde-activating enzyme